MLEYVALLTPVYVPLFWFLVLFTQNKTNSARNFLSMFMLVATGLYIGHAIYFFKYFEIFTWYDSVYTLTSLLVYPMFYVYLRLLSSESRLQKKHYKHFIPAVFFSVIIFLCTVMMTKDEAKDYFNYYINAFFYVSESSSIFIQIKKYTYITSRVFFSIQIVYYMVLCLKTLRIHSKHIYDLYSNIGEKELLWVKSLIVIFSVTSVSSFAVNILGKELFLANSELLLIPSIVFSTMLFLIGFSGNMQKQIVNEIDIDKKNDYIGIHLESISNKDLIVEKIKEVLIKNNLYLDSDLKIWDICLMVDIDRVTLTKIIHESFHTDFVSLINQYRINEAKSILENNPKMEMIEVSKKSGFDSLNSFIKAFKKIEGVSPLVKYPK